MKNSRKTTEKEKQDVVQRTPLTDEASKEKDDDFFGKSGKKDKKMTL